MKFNIELVTKTSGRIGVIQKSANVSIKTPALLLGTKVSNDNQYYKGSVNQTFALFQSGSLPYLSKEVFDLIIPTGEQAHQLLGINVQSTLEMSESLKSYTKGISSFVGLGNLTSFVHLNDQSMVARLQHNEANGIPVFAKSGKKVLSPKSFMELLDSFAPDAVVLLGDTNLSSDAGKNRSRKSVNKTMEFIDKCLEMKGQSDRLKDTFILAPIVGSAKEFDRKELLTHIGQLNTIDGYSIEGLHKMGPDALMVEEAPFLATVKLLLVSEYKNECICF